MNNPNLRNGKRALNHNAGWPLRALTGYLAAFTGGMTLSAAIQTFDNGKWHGFLAYVGLAWTPIAALALYDRLRDNKKDQPLSR